MSAACGICISPFREEIERKAKKGKPANIVNWARERGVTISYNSLARHRENHMVELKPSDNGHKGGSEVVLIEQNPKKKRTGAIEGDSPKVEIGVRPVSDEILLDAVRDAVYGKLCEGALELEINSAFKAIELKYKVAEQSQSEKLMLEILNEIRGQELGK